MSTLIKGATQTSDLIIDLSTDGWCRYEGTASQLIAQGLIPQDFNWPRGRDYQRWSVNGFDFSLHRWKPVDHKGPMKSWLEADNWILNIISPGYSPRELPRDPDEMTTQTRRQVFHHPAAHTKPTLPGVCIMKLNDDPLLPTNHAKELAALGREATSIAAGALTTLHVIIGAIKNISEIQDGKEITGDAIKALTTIADTLGEDYCSIMCDFRSQFEGEERAAEGCVA